MGDEIGVERQTPVPVLLGWLRAGRCPQDPKFVHVTPMRATEGASVAAHLDYPATAQVDGSHACGVPATLDVDPTEVAVLP